MIMTSMTDGYTLPGGVKMPCVGFGTWQTPDGDVARDSVKKAIECGYRHIDTAAVYGNEESVGDGIIESGIPREELFLTTKVWNNDHGYEETLKAFEASSRRLKTDYFDLYLIHWPNPKMYRDTWKERNAGTWRAMEELHRAGKLRTIGVSNFFPRHFDALLETAEIMPMVNQIRLYPGEAQPETVSYCKEKGVLLQAYSPFGTGKIFEAPELIALSGKYGKSIAQICIRWSLQSGFVPLPKSVTPARIEENAKVFDFELAAEDVQVLNAMQNYCGPTTDPDTTPF